VIPAGRLTREALEFFAFLALELTAIYFAVVLVVELLQARLGPDRLRSMLGGTTGPKRFVVAAGLGAVTPFCSCSTVPLVAGMNRAGVEWLVLGAFLVISPLVNPALVALMWALVGPTYAALYVAASLVVAVLVGLTIQLTGWGEGLETDDASAIDPSQASTDGWGLRAAWREAHRSTLRLTPVFLAAGVLGAVLKHGVGTEWVRGILAGTGWWGVPAAAIIGVPVYASTAVLLPMGACCSSRASTSASSAPSSWARPGSASPRV